MCLFKLSIKNHSLPAVALERECTEIKIMDMKNETKQIFGFHTSLIHFTSMHST